MATWNPTGTHAFENRAIGESGFGAGCRCQGCIDGHHQHMREYRRRPEVRARRQEHNRKWREQHEKEWLSHYRADGTPYRCRVRNMQKEYSEWLATIKMEAGCADCGFDEHPAALEFDHVRGRKLFALSVGCGRNREVQLAEIAKCEVVCSNCHHIRTYRRKIAADTQASASETAR